MKKVLFISPTCIVTKSVKAALLSRSFDVLMCESSVEGLSLALLNPYDLIITSVFMDGLDGIQFFNAIRFSKSLNSLCPYFMLSSVADISEGFGVLEMPEAVLEKNSDLIENLNMELDTYFATDEPKGEEDLKILYVEDSSFLVGMVKSWMKKYPYINVEYCTSLAGFDTIKIQDFDIILSDNLLGDGDITDVLLKLKEVGLAKVPVIVYTATTNTLNIHELGQLGNVKEIKEKPFNISGLVATIKKYKA